MPGRVPSGHNAWRQDLTIELGDREYRLRACPHTLHGQCRPYVLGEPAQNGRLRDAGVDPLSYITAKPLQGW